MINRRHLLGYGGLAAATGTMGIACASQAGQTSTAAGGNEPLPDPLNPRDPRNPGAPLLPREGWDQQPWSGWTYQHVSEMLPSAPIWRGSGPVRPLPESLQLLGDLMIQFDDGARSVNDYLEQDFTDGFLVLHWGRIVFERYMNNLTPHQQHTLMSVTKSFMSTLAGIFVDKGVLDLQKPTAHYLPELEATAYKGATVQQVLDMASGVVASDEDLNSLKVWYQQPAPGGPRTSWELALSLDKSERPHGSSMEYRSIETDVLGFILQRVSGKSIADLISQEIWGPMGAERDAYTVVDLGGYGVGSGGLCGTMRDVGRFAQLLVEGGAWGGRQIVPHNWIDECRKGSGWRFQRDNKRAYRAAGYHNQWWIQDADSGALGAQGMGGQIVYVDPDAEFAAVKLSHWPHDEKYRQRWHELAMVVMPAIRAALRS